LAKNFKGTASVFTVNLGQKLHRILLRRPGICSVPQRIRGNIVLLYSDVLRNGIKDDAGILVWMVGFYDQV
jgi:hypothetical protein